MYSIVSGRCLIKFIINLQSYDHSNGNKVFNKHRSKPTWYFISFIHIHFIQEQVRVLFSSVHASSHAGSSWWRWHYLCQLKDKHDKGQSGCASKYQIEFLPDVLCMHQPVTCSCYQHVWTLNKPFTMQAVRGWDITFNYIS